MMIETRSPASAPATLEQRTVNDLILSHPEAVAVFNRFGIDACCGGDAPVLDAARRDGADPEKLSRALLQVLSQG